MMCFTEKTNRNKQGPQTPLVSTGAGGTLEGQELVEGMIVCEFGLWVWFREVVFGVVLGVGFAVLGLWERVNGRGCRWLEMQNLRHIAHQTSRETGVGNFGWIGIQVGIHYQLESIMFVALYAHNIFWFCQCFK